ncbi:hypothetical protein EDB83DRAFT_2314467 [Lactarius deliciosus]|nr:hypothetical protein EDB83DRAFT_2314467 [Lactarius deliciosus]
MVVHHRAILTITSVVTVLAIATVLAVAAIMRQLSPCHGRGHGGGGGGGGSSGGGGGGRGQSSQGHIRNDVGTDGPGLELRDKSKPGSGSVRDGEVPMRQRMSHGAGSERETKIESANAETRSRERVKGERDESERRRSQGSFDLREFQVPSSGLTSRITQVNDNKKGENNDAFRIEPAALLST